MFKLLIIVFMFLGEVSSLLADNPQRIVATYGTTIPFPHDPKFALVVKAGDPLEVIVLYNKATYKKEAIKLSNGLENQTLLYSDENAFFVYSNESAAGINNFNIIIYDKTKPTDDVIKKKNADAIEIQNKANNERNRQALMIETRQRATIARKNFKVANVDYNGELLITFKNGSGFDVSKAAVEVIIDGIRTKYGINFSPNVKATESRVFKIKPAKIPVSPDINIDVLAIYSKDGVNFEGE